MKLPKDSYFEYDGIIFMAMAVVGVLSLIIWGGPTQ